MLIYSKGVCHYYNRCILKLYEMHLKIALKFIFSDFFKIVAFDSLNLTYIVLRLDDPVDHQF